MTVPLTEKGWYRLLKTSTMVDHTRRWHPKVGDTVIALAMRKIDPTMIGTLTEIEENGGDPIYHVTALDGERQRWENVEVAVVEEKN